MEKNLLGKTKINKINGKKQWFHCFTWSDLLITLYHSIFIEAIYKFKQNWKHQATLYLHKSNHVRLEPEFGGKRARWGVELVSTDNEVGQDLVTRNCNTVRGKEWCNVWRATFRLQTEVINETNKQQKIDACVSKWSQLWVDKVSEN